MQDIHDLLITKISLTVNAIALNPICPVIRHLTLLFRGDLRIAYNTGYITQETFDALFRHFLDARNARLGR